MGTIHAQGKGTRLAKLSIARRHVLISLAVQRSTEMPIFLFNLEIIHTRTEVEIVLIPGVCSSDNCLLIFTLPFVILSAIFIYWLAIDETVLTYLFKKWCIVLLWKSSSGYLLEWSCTIYGCHMHAELAVSRNVQESAIHGYSGICRGESMNFCFAKKHPWIAKNLTRSNNPINGFVTNDDVLKSSKFDCAIDFCVHSSVVNSITSESFIYRSTEMQNFALDDNVKGAVMVVDFLAPMSFTFCLYVL